ncbi:sulfurtransferase [Sphingomonas sp. ID0503]|uniref:sulfurtransferase n=1 Tax=Sphingomonas sp. ID0503 TaxID=3399691 RepID=UPI003AFAD26D
MTFNTLINAEALSGLIASHRVRVVDCTFDLADPAAGRRQFEAGHIPGAQYLHLDEDLSGKPTGTNGRHPLPDPAVLAAKLRAIGLDRGPQVVAYDSSGGIFAARLWWLLRWLGHDAVAVLDGGRKAWTEAGYELQTGPTGTLGPGDFVERNANATSIANAEEILGNIEDGRRLVLDARAPGRFAGEPNPLDPVAGHIPGARNRFFGDNLQADGRFKPAAALRAEYEVVLDGVEPSDVILSCGSGVTACHDLLAMELAGLSGARLYPGSWSEWVADPSRPIERT